MYLEKRKAKHGARCYLVHSYRDGKEVRKIRRYLGQGLSKEALKRERKRAEQDILGLIGEMGTQVFLFSLSPAQIRLLNKHDDRMEVIHLNRKEWERFTEEFVYNTNAIEGSTVQRGKVGRILRGPAQDADELEAKGVAQAVDFIRKSKEDLSIRLMRKLHSICFNGTKGFSGKLRTVEVVIRDVRGEIIHKGVPARHLMEALGEMILWYRENRGKFRPLVLAAIIHNQFEYIHPFQDGNGRVGRLLLNHILLREGYPPVSISLEDRAEYYRVLQEYQRSRDLRPSMQFLASQYKKTLRRVTTKAKKR